jgi:hypothetical protein
MNFSDYSLSLEEIALITPENIAQSPAAVVLLRIAKACYEKQTARLVSGELGSYDDEPRRDFRFALGECSLAKVLLDAPQEAKKWCSQT